MDQITPVSWHTIDIWRTYSPCHHFRRTSYWPGYTFPVPVVPVIFRLSCFFSVFPQLFIELLIHTRSLLNILRFSTEIPSVHFFFTTIMFENYRKPNLPNYFIPAWSNCLNWYFVINLYSGPRFKPALSRSRKKIGRRKLRVRPTHASGFSRYRLMVNFRVVRLLANASLVFASDATKSSL